MRRPVSVTAFVDWNAQVHNARANELEPTERAKQTLQRTARSIGTALTRQAPATRFTVAMRLYHGWHKGWEPTENLRAITATASQVQFSTFAYSNIHFSHSRHYGHTLLAALPERSHERTAIHLPNTLRQQSRGSQPEEKMVDTSLAADLLHWARNDPVSVASRSGGIRQPPAVDKPAKTVPSAPEVGLRSSYSRDGGAFQRGYAPGRAPFRRVSGGAETRPRTLSSGHAD